MMLVSLQAYHMKTGSISAQNPAPTPDPDGEEVHDDVSPLESILEEVCQTGCVLDRWPQIDRTTPRQNRK